ncbi:MAG: MarR family transcriptional regulator [Ignavibacteria bacterium]|jgi:DNA-binding MarR family transcriptional regulator
MSTKKLLDKQTAEFHTQIVELVKKYQFRDRDQILSCGISVSQCYILETLSTSGPLTTGELAKKMYLSISTVTRVVDQLVKKKYVVREEDSNDRRIHITRLTKSGEKVYRESWENIFQSERMILQNFKPENRDMLIDFLKQLNSSVQQWHDQCEIK